MKRILASAVGVVAVVWGASTWVTAQPLSGAKKVELAVGGYPARVERIVRRLATELADRHGANPARLAEASLWLRSELATLGLDAGVHGYEARGATYSNLLARLGPPEGEVVVVGAHYDAHPATPGADDNASGVAALLEVARVLKASSVACPVELALWTLEEPPFFRTQDMGSARHVAKLRREGVAVRAAFSLEMLGYYREDARTQEYPPRFTAQPLYPSRGNFVLLVGDLGATGLTRRLKAAWAGTSALPVESVNVSRAFPGADFSDHQSFWNAGITAFMVTDSAFLRNPNYHRATDTADTLDFGRLAAAATGVAAMVLEACHSAP